MVCFHGADGEHDGPPPVAIDIEALQAANAVPRPGPGPGNLQGNGAPNHDVRPLSDAVLQDAAPGHMAAEDPPLAVQTVTATACKQPSAATGPPAPTMSDSPMVQTVHLKESETPASQSPDAHAPQLPAHAGQQPAVLEYHVEQSEKVPAGAHIGREVAEAREFGN